MASSLEFSFVGILQFLVGKHSPHSRGGGSRPQAEAAGSSKKEPAESAAPGRVSHLQVVLAVLISQAVSPFACLVMLMHNC